MKDATTLSWLDFHSCSLKVMFFTEFNNIMNFMFSAIRVCSDIIVIGKTGVMDRGYQSHKRFDQWQRDGTLFMCRIKAGTKKTIVKKNSIATDSIVFFDAVVVLGTTEINQTQEPLRLVGYEVDRVKYWIATDRYDLTAEQIAAAYKLRWDIESFFAWWKRHLKVYHLIARSEHGLMVQILAGLITYCCWRFIVIANLTREFPSNAFANYA